MKKLSLHVSFSTLGSSKTIHKIYQNDKVSHPLQMTLLLANTVTIPNQDSGL